MFGLRPHVQAEKNARDEARFAQYLLDRYGLTLQDLEEAADRKFMSGELPTAPVKLDSNREKFMEALAEAGFAGFTTFSSPVLEAYDKVHCPNLRK